MQCTRTGRFRFVALALLLTAGALEAAVPQVDDPRGGRGLPKSQGNRQRPKRVCASTQAVTPAPHVGARDYVIYGFVCNHRGSGIPGLTLALYDETGQWLRQFGYGETDARGYFEIRLRNRSTSPRELGPPGAADSGPAGGKPKSAPATKARANAASTRVVELRIHNSDKNRIYRETQSVPPTPGRMDFREIQLEAEGERTLRK